MGVPKSGNRMNIRQFMGFLQKLFSRELQITNLIYEKEIVHCAFSYTTMQCISWV